MDQGFRRVLVAGARVRITEACCGVLDVGAVLVVDWVVGGALHYHYAEDVWVGKGDERFPLIAPAAKVAQRSALMFPCVFHFRQAHELQQADVHPADVEFEPARRETCRFRVRMVIVVELFSA